MIAVSTQTVCLAIGFGHRVVRVAEDKGLPGTTVVQLICPTLGKQAVK